MAMTKNEGTFLSSDQQHQLHYCVWTPEGNPLAVLQICHGMNETIERYEELAEKLADQGFVVCGHDMLGHGPSCPPEERGFFGSSDGSDYLINDVEEMRKIMRKKYRALPYVLLGHSMGSFICRAYVTRYPNGADGLILSGTSGSVKILKNGLRMLKLLIALKGERYRSTWVHSIQTKGYNDRFKAENDSYSWLSKNTEDRTRFVSHPDSAFIFTLRGYQDMLTILSEVSTEEWAGKYPKNLPVLFLTGKDDPVGDYGAGVQEVCDRLEDAYVSEISLRLYDNCRHELFHEPELPQVIEDMTKWILGVREGVLECRMMGWRP